MRYALDSEQMQAAERAAVASGVVTIAELMDRAGHALADTAGARVPEGRIIVVCGPGNNGGDGWVAARVLASRGRDVTVLALRHPDLLAGEARVAAHAALQAGVPWKDCAKTGAGVEDFSSAGLIVDAIFGFGLHGAAREPYDAWVRRIDDVGAFVVSADIPSGVDSDTGEAAGPAVVADVTVTFSALKTGLLIGEGAASAGEIIVADLGIGDHVRDIQDPLRLPGADEVRDIVPWPAPADHKGSRGKVALVVGSEVYRGAAVLAAGGALRMGAGYVYVVTLGGAADAVIAAWPSAIVRSVRVASDGSFAHAEDVLAAIPEADAVIVGPGITCSDEAREVVLALLGSYEGPLLLDADALNVLAGDTAPLHDRRAPTLITPHPGEAARLLGTTVEEIERDRVHSARCLSGESLVCVLKGSGTIIAGAGAVTLVRTGGPELARAGTGDVLAGMIGTLLAQGCGAHDAAVAATYLHGRAGAHGAARLTRTALIASDLPESIPEAVRELAGG
ncbi:MAG: NAD(P)H-hydrate dehydratase [Coriobacteriia bacterium]|nr:NAD(P)H-hydrate dehydratase [Coriobacteriia bacterium]